MYSPCISPGLNPALLKIEFNLYRIQGYFCTVWWVSFSHVTKHSCRSSCIATYFPLMTVSLCIREDWLFYRRPSFLAVVWFGSMPPPPPPPFPVSEFFSLSQFTCVLTFQFNDGRGGRGRAWSRIIPQRESLVLYKSFNTLCWASVNCSNLSARNIPRWPKNGFSKPVYIFNLALFLTPGNSG